MKRQVVSLLIAFLVVMTQVVVADRAFAQKYVANNATVKILLEANVPFGTAGGQTAYYLNWVFGRALPQSYPLGAGSTTYPPVLRPLGVLGTGVNGGQCATFVQTVIPALPRTVFWTRGGRVLSMIYPLPMGTAIAYFDGGNSCPEYIAGHAAILLWSGPGYIFVADQNWNGDGLVRVHAIAKTCMGGPGDAWAYFVIN